MNGEERKGKTKGQYKEGEDAGTTREEKVYNKNKGEQERREGEGWKRESIEK